MLKIAILATLLVVASAGSLARNQEYPQYSHINYENSRHRELGGYDHYGLSGFGGGIFRLGSYGLGGYDGYRFFGNEDNGNAPENRESVIQETSPPVGEEKDDENPEIPGLGNDEKFLGFLGDGNHHYGGLFDDHSLASNPARYTGEIFELGYLDEVTDAASPVDYKVLFPNGAEDEAQAGDNDEEQVAPMEEPFEETPSAEHDEAEAGDEPEAATEEDDQDRAEDNAYGFGIYDNLILWGLDNRPGYGGFYNRLNYDSLALA